MDEHQAGSELRTASEAGSADSGRTLESTAEGRLTAAQAEIAQLREALAGAELRVQTLNHELQHRVRNMLAVIRSILRRSRESGASRELFAEHFEGRLSAIARYQTYVDGVGAGIELEDMVRNELFEVHWLDGPNCQIQGPPVRLRQKSAELLGLTIHELTTNAIKFGALAQDGRLRVAWSIEDGDGARRLYLSWLEMGVSIAAAAPRPSGFGRQLIEEALPYQLGAATSFDLKPGGLECTITLPLVASDQADIVSGDLAAEESLILPSEPEL